MTYAGQRRMIDANSHLMEWPTFLTEFAPADVAARLPKLVPDVGPWSDPRRTQRREALVSLGSELLRKGPKWHDALGAVDPAERSTALDLLGFERQVVYSSFCARLFDIAEPALRHAAYRAHNRAMAAFVARGRERATSDSGGYVNQQAVHGEHPPTIYYRRWPAACSCSRNTLAFSTGKSLEGGPKQSAEIAGRG